MRETKAKSGAGIEVSLTVKLDRASYVPYYEQIVSQMREAIVARRLPSGKALWSQRELAEILGISVLPVKRAFERLRTEGLLITSKGKRPVVGAGHVPLNVQDLWSFSEEMKSRGLVASNRLLSFALIPASEEVSAALELNEGRKCIASCDCVPSSRNRSRWRLPTFLLRCFPILNLTIGIQARCTPRLRMSTNIGLTVQKSALVQ
jgi:DNA-binding transcriptional regulator YhcF (GntR family)